MITLEQAKSLRYGQILIHDLTGKRWRDTGQPKVWKRTPSRVQVPVKHGLYAYDYVTENELDIVSMEE